MSNNLEEENIQAFRELFAGIHAADKEKSPYVSEAPEAARRLARAVYGHDNSQAQTVAAALASIYNGSEARPVRLDELRWLDWTLLRDLLAVMVGTGSGGFEDHHIRDAFREVGGEPAVEWFHWYTTGGPHRAALGRLVAFIKENAKASSATNLKALLLSIVHTKTPAALGHLNYIDDNWTQDFVLVLEGLFGRDQGTLHIEDVQVALASAELF